MTLQDEMLKDASTGMPSKEELTELEQLTKEQLHLEALLKDQEKMVNETKKRLDEVRGVAIPAVLDQAGIKKFTLSNGSSVELKETVFASIRAAEINRAMDWLCKNKLGGIIKSQITIKLAPGQTELGDEAMAACEELGLSPESKLSVHPQTLKATVKEQQAKGVQFPDEYFSIYPDRKAVIKQK